MTTITAARPRPLAALAKAEWLQFRRNKTLVYLATLFPIGIPLVTYFLVRKDNEPTTAMAAIAFELLALMALLFVQYYSVLSLVTTRRGEGVLKRLRTGEAADWQIQLAPMVPGILATLGCTAVVTVGVYGSGAPAPVNPLLMVAALVGGTVVFALLALATSAVTKNAEAAQITSMPVMILAMLGMMSLRNILPDRLAALADWTPFAAVSDLVFLGAAGRTATAAESDPVLSLADTLTASARPFATLALWTVLALALTRKSFRWDDRG
ncbi:membrane protein [Nocardia neocaledoniensis NBRC 108232]|uniref:ABC-2 type transport system permease protein n=1 Tax=Nocardia neocaledoniensis TaxID=236511 RepID=A0A317N803_9NOCA|nr:ABC transporter permease [Nocardia neocaledoniensis]PWV71122.1 ABC-2 type transport system permease protein [Nocardia neocaledoniensis]GEM30216.1 membrane protein [Nocardia neocaledoniensis NBRC 108232]